jgi:NhaP-type Na+/H+ or K+/H+ antiporter
MEETLLITALAAFILAFGAISKRIQTTVITAPMIFVAFGLLISERGLGLVHGEIGSEFISIIAELTLILILFTDASRIDLRRLRHQHNIPIRLLGIGLPLTMLVGTLVAFAMFDVPNIWTAAILAVILAPTDAALGQAVVSSPKVPVRIRQALNIESGLNDGIALPFLLFFVAVASAAERPDPAYWLRFGAAQIIRGPVVGIAVGYIGGKLVTWSEDKQWMADAFQKLAALGISLLAFGLAELVGGNGFLAAFCAGMIMGNFFSRACTRLYEFAEAEGQLLTLATFTIYGALMVWPAFDHFNLTFALYAVLSLTLIRMIPVAISLIGLKLQARTTLFLGWFGPRGIASIIYGFIIIEEEGLLGQDIIFTIMVITVFFSVFAHGLTAAPAADRYGAHAETMKDEDMPEMMPVDEMPLRLPYRT